MHKTIISGKVNVVGVETKRFDVIQKIYQNKEVSDSSDISSMSFSDSDLDDENDMLGTEPTKELDSEAHELLGRQHNIVEAMRHDLEKQEVKRKMREKVRHIGKTFEGRMKFKEWRHKRWAKIKERKLAEHAKQEKAESHVKQNKTHVTELQFSCSVKVDQTMQGRPPLVRDSKQWKHARKYFLKLAKVTRI